MNLNVNKVVMIQNKSIINKILHIYQDKIKKINALYKIIKAHNI